MGVPDAHDGMLDLFELLDDDTNLIDNFLSSSELNLAGLGDHHDHVQQGCSKVASQLQSVPKYPPSAQQQAIGFAMDVGVPGLSMDAAWQQATHQQLDSSKGYAVGPTVFTSPDAASKYADTAALVAAAQAQMDAASPGHGAAGVQLQHVVSAASIQLQQMVQRQAMFASKAPAQAGAAFAASSGMSAPQLQQTQQMQQLAQAQHMQQSQPMLLQQQAHQQSMPQQNIYMQQQQQAQAQAQQVFQQQLQQQQQPAASTPFGMQPAQQQPQQAQAPQQQRKQPAFSASTMDKAAAIAGQAGAQQAQMPASAPRAPSYNLGHMPAQSMASAQASLATAGPAPGLQVDAAAAAAAGFFQRPASLAGAASGGLDPAFAAAATGADPAAARLAFAAAATAAMAAQQQGLGLALPDQFKGVMLTPAGAVTGVAVGPNLMHWVQGLQHLASQQQEARAAKSKQKAARKKDKVQDLQAELADKQAQLQALSLENLALAAKARALEQLVKSAGDDVTLMEEQLASLSIQQETQEDSKQAAAAAAAAVAAIQGQAVWPQHLAAQQPLQPPVPLRPPQQPMQPAPVQMQQQQPPPPQQPQVQSRYQQQQQPQQQPQQRQPQGGINPQFKQLHQQLLQNLMDTPLESLEDILGGLAPTPATSAAPAQRPARSTAAAGPSAAAAVHSIAPIATGFTSGPPAAAAAGGGGMDWQVEQPAAQQRQQQQQQQQLSPELQLFQQWSPPLQQQQLSPEQQLFQQWSPPLQQQQQQQSNPGTSAGSFGGTSSSGMPQGSAASMGVQSSCDDVSSPPSGRTQGAASSLSDPAMHGNLFGTAASAAAAAQAAAAGTGGGLLLALQSDNQKQMFEAAAMAYPNAFRPTQQLEEKLPEIQAVHKRVVLQLMPLLLQVQQERISYNLKHYGNSLPQQQELNTPAMQQLIRVMLEYSKDIHTFAIANRVSTYELYTLNIETGILGQPPPEGHWNRVAGMLKDRLTPQALADLCVARQLYSSTLMRIKQQRQLLVLQLAQLVSNTHSKPAGETYRTDAVFYGLSGPHGQGSVLLDSIEKNMRKEYTLEGVYQWMTHHIIPMHVLAELVVHSYPYKADIHMTLQELMRDQPMPALTALQQLQLKQLQEQQHSLHQAAQQQQAAAMLAQQQQAAQRLQVLNQQRGLLAAGGIGAPGGFTGMMF